MSGGHDPAGTVIVGTHISPRTSTTSFRPNEIDDPSSFWAQVVWRICRYVARRREGIGTPNHHGIARPSATVAVIAR